MSAQRDEESARFFDAAAQGTLLALHCGSCGQWVTPYLFHGSPSRQCRSCHTGQLDWQPTRGTGTLLTWTLIPGVVPVIDGSPVQASGIVELAEGPWLACALDIPVVTLRAGLPVRVGFARPGGGEPVPVFRAI